VLLLAHSARRSPLGIAHQLTGTRAAGPKAHRHLSAGFHATLDDRVAPVLLHFRTEAELAEGGTPWTGGPCTQSMRGEELPGISAFLRVGDEAFHTYSTYGRGIEGFHNGYQHLDLTWRTPGCHVGCGPVSAG
jgi:Bacterial protein of unknown function (DUF899)